MKKCELCSIYNAEKDSSKCESCNGVLNHLKKSSFFEKTYINKFGFSVNIIGFKSKNSEI